MFVRPVLSAPMKLKMKAKMMERMEIPTFWPYWKPRTIHVKKALITKPPVHIHHGTCSWSGAGSSIKSFSSISTLRKDLEIGASI